MSGERFSAPDRALLAALADCLIPAGGGLPAASEAGVAGQGLDLVLAARPDLAEGLERVLAFARGRGPAAALAELEARDPAGFGVLAEVVPGAYFMDPRVRAAVGYAGQGPRPIDPEVDGIDPELLAPVIARGPIYRPTPGEESR